MKTLRNNLSLLLFILPLMEGLNARALDRINPPFGLTHQMGRAFYSERAIPIHVYTQVNNCQELKTKLLTQLPRNYRLDLYDGPNIQTLMLLPPLELKNSSPELLKEKIRGVTENLYGFTCTRFPNGKNLVMGTELGKVLAELKTPQPYHDPLFVEAPFAHRTLANVRYEFGGYKITQVQEIGETSMDGLKNYVTNRMRELNYGDRQIVMEETMNKDTESSGTPLRQKNSPQKPNSEPTERFNKVMFVDFESIDEKNSLLTLQIIDRPANELRNEWRVEQ